MEAADIYLETRYDAPIRLTQNHRKKPPQIEHNIPLPAGFKKTRGGARNFSHYYPFEEMQPRDSFWVEGKSNGCTCGAVSRFMKRTGWRLITRSQTKDGRPNKEEPDQRKHGIRVWRIT